MGVKIKSLKSNHVRNLIIWKHRLNLVKETGNFITMRNQQFFDSRYTQDERENYCVEIIKRIIKQQKYDETKQNNR